MGPQGMLGTQELATQRIAKGAIGTNLHDDAGNIYIKRQ